MLRSTEALLGLKPPRSQYLEAYRRLRTALFALRDEHPFRSVLITSASPNEGKTVVTLNLAMLVAQAGLKTTVLDGDFAHPVIHHVWGLQEAPGITDACVGTLELPQIMQPTELENLFVVTAGATSNRGPDLVSGTTMPSIINALMDQNDLLFVDSAPVLASAGTLQLARMVDCVLVVARARENVGAPRRALKMLKDIGRDARGVIVNDILEQDSEAPSYYYYGTSRTTPA